MGKIDKFTKISYYGHDYAVFEIKYKTKMVPIVLDWNDFNYVKNLNKSWFINESGNVVCIHELSTQANTFVEVYLHEIVMSLIAKERNTQPQKKSIIHINRLGIDNRRDNLMYDNVNKETNKNIKKKKRIIQLPKKSGIDPDELPTYVWYLKPDSTHNERFMVSIGDITWKTTSSNKLSLRYKLEEAKKYLRHLKSKREDLFDDYSMNGEYTKDGKLLLLSFYDIIKGAGFNNIKELQIGNLTNEYLAENTKSLSPDEKLLLDTKTFY